MTYLPELLKSPYLETDVRKAIKVQFDELFDELKEIARETESYLDFNILLLYMDHA